MSGRLLLDGALGTELRARGIAVPDYTTSIWSALALLDAPAAIETLHRDYIEAGADIITANSYAVSPILLAREGLAHRSAELAALAGRLARAATGASNARVAGSLAPLNTTYRADLVGPFDELVATYTMLARAMADSVDLFICETMSSSIEAAAAARAASGTGKPVWVAYAIRGDGRLRSGETLTDAVAALAPLPVAAVLVNCCSTRTLEDALPELARLSGIAIGGYPNDVEAVADQHDLDAGHYARLPGTAFAAQARRWLAAGATIIGGCCGTGPRHIAALRRLLDDYGAA